MKITRYVNGKRIDGSIAQKITVDSSEIVNTITNVNRRLDKEMNKNQGKNNGNMA